MIPEELKRAVGKYISFTQTAYSGYVEGYVNRAYLSKTYHAYWNKKDNPRCRECTGDIKNNEIPSWADYGWILANNDGVWYGDLKILDEEDLGTW